MGKLTINGHRPFSIAMLIYQRVAALKKTHGYEAVKKLGWLSSSPKKDINLQKQHISSTMKQLSVLGK